MKRRGPAQPIMRECDHCSGCGEVEVLCDDCGEELFTNTVAQHDKSGDDLCLTCEKNRAEDEDRPETDRVTAKGNGR